MFDWIEKLDKSTIQHGKNNNRIYLMKLDRADEDLILTKLDQIAEKEGYTKIIAKVPEWAKERFIQHGYLKECSIPYFYKGEGMVHFLSRFTSSSRSFISPDAKKKIDKNISIANIKKNEVKQIMLPHEFTLRQL